MDIIIVPVAHVSEESVKAVRAAVEREKPQVVAIELDEARFAGMVSGKKPSIGDLARQPFFAILYLFQQFAGKFFGISPGSEMMAAADAARAENIPIAFVDRPMPITMARLVAIPLGEKLSIAAQVLFAPLAFIPWPGVKRVPITPELLVEAAQAEEILVEFKKRLPNTYRVMVEERDTYMANMVARINVEKVVLVVGAGHVPGLTREIKRIAEKPPPGVAS